LSAIPKSKRVNKGFKSASSFLNSLTQKSLEKKGFSQSKLITNWYEIVGTELSKYSMPFKITFPKNGLGATLLLEIDGAFGPEIELQKEIIKEKVNRLYGYTAISKVTFRISPSLGYQAKKKKELFFKVDDKKAFEARNHGVGGPALHESISNLGNIQNDALRDSLNEISKNFLKQLE
jgi:hypothetical protein